MKHAKILARQYRSNMMASQALVPDPLLAGLNHELACFVPHPARVRSSGIMTALAEAMGQETWEGFIARAGDTAVHVPALAQDIASHPRYKLLVEDEQDPGSLACLAAVWLAFCQRGPQVVVTRDALDWTLAQSDMDPSLRAESFAWRESAIYLQFGEYPGKDEDDEDAVKTAFYVQGKGLIEGAYLFASTDQGSRRLEIVLAVRSDMPGLASSLIFTSTSIQDDGLPLSEILDGLVTTSGPRGTPLALTVIDHIAKVLLYVGTGSDVEKEVLPPNPTSEDVHPHVLTRPYPVVLLGPASLSRLRLDIEAPAAGVAEWRRGMFSRFLDHGTPMLRWKPPRLELA
jgi:hypothetical protein